MAHWGWYWKIKKRHVPKSFFSWESFLSIDSFAMFKNTELVSQVKERAEKISFEMPGYELKATLLPNNNLSVQYAGGSYIIPVEKKPCTYGGYYYFFHCPQCDARMRKLYCNDGKYLCRKCLKLGYFSQRLRPSIRNLLKQASIKKTLCS